MEMELLEFKQLNESQSFIQRVSEEKSGFSGIIYEEDFKSIDTKYSEFVKLNENQNCFYEWLLNDLNESEKKKEKTNPPKPSKEEKKEDKTEEATLEYNEAADEKKIESKLSSAAKKDLKETEKDSDLSEKSKFFQQVQNSQLNLKKKKQGKSYYQGAAGFVNDNNYFSGIDNNGFTY